MVATESATDLESIAHALVAEGKGILAADESDGTIKKRFDSIGVESTKDNRRAYRELLFTTEGAEEYISGVILFDETIRQSSADGTPFPKVLESRGIIPGMMPRLSKSFGKGVPSAELCRIVSSNRITPLMNSSTPGVVKSRSR